MSNRRDKRRLPVVRSSQRARSRNTKGGPRVSDLVTDINLKPSIARVLRYRFSTTSTKSITRADLLSSIVAVTNGSTTAVSLIDAIKVTGVRISLLPNDDGDATNLSFSWTGDRGPDLLHSLMCTNAVPRAAFYSPPPDSLAGFWSIHTSDTSETLFSLTLDNAGCNVITDIHVTYVLGDNSTATQTLTGAATISGVVLLALPIGDGSFNPVGLTSLSAT